MNIWPQTNIKNIIPILQGHNLKHSHKSIPKGVKVLSERIIWDIELTTIDIHSDQRVNEDQED